MTKFYHFCVLFGDYFSQFLPFLVFLLFLDAVVSGLKFSLERKLGDVFFVLFLQFPLFLVELSLLHLFIFSDLNQLWIFLVRIIQSRQLSL